ncbi:protein LE25-like [Salvia hispanica]|uniref:protein LE25-like n=1 Tax=Salvia hispanica TaxID=49212 RepID=UPI002008F2CF|nr:protein LE25-like [Salvia hispanica]
MQSAKDMAASAKAGMEKTKATLQEKGERMTTRDPLQKEMATEKKEERIDEAELRKRDAQAQHEAQYRNTGTGTGANTTGFGTGGTY